MSSGMMPPMRRSERVTCSEKMKHELNLGRFGRGLISQRGSAVQTNRVSFAARCEPECENWCMGRHNLPEIRRLRQISCHNHNRQIILPKVCRRPIVGKIDNGQYNSVCCKHPSVWDATGYFRLGPAHHQLSENCQNVEKTEASLRWRQHPDSSSRNPGPQGTRLTNSESN